MKRLILGGQSLITGAGSIECLKDIDFNRVFIVTGGKSMFKNGVIEKIETIIKEKGCESFVYSGVPKNPDTKVVLDGAEKMKKFNPDTVIAVGGGSPMDASKVMITLYENEDISFDNILSKELPEKRTKVKLIAIPSTSGTGSEVTKSAVVTFKDTDLKIGLKAESFIPDVAILDPTITLTMPDNVVAETGMDAVTHAVECYINKGLDDFSACLAKGAVEGLFKYLPISFKEKTLESREKVHYSQCMAALAFANVGLGLAHGIAHAIGGKFNLAHGLINAVVLPYVIQYNKRDLEVNDRIKELEKVVDSKDFVLSVKNLNEEVKIPRCLKEAGIEEKEFEDNLFMLVQNSLKGSTRVNPVNVSEEDMVKILRCVYYGNDIDF